MLEVRHISSGLKMGVSLSPSLRELSARRARRRGIKSETGYTCGCLEQYFRPKGNSVCFPGGREQNGRVKTVVRIIFFIIIIIFYL